MKTNYLSQSELDETFETAVAKNEGVYEKTIEFFLRWGRIVETKVNNKKQILAVLKSK